MGPRQNVGSDLVAGGDWLFRQGELILGPVPSQQIVDLLFNGDLDGRSEVQKMGSGHFVPLSQVDVFKVHLAKAQAKHRVDAQARSVADAAKRRRMVRIGVVAAICTVTAVGAAYVAGYMAVHKPWKNADELAYAELISVEAPTITRAKVRREEEDLVAYPGMGTTSKGSDRPGEKPTRLASAKKGAPKLTGESEDPDGMQMAQVDYDAINAVVAAKQKTLYPCLLAEAQKKPGLSARIPVEFVIGNDGRVSKVWVDHPQFKTGSLPECLLRELQKWRFKPNEAGGASVQVPFKIGKG
ncbi:MAG: AgmX/PglI C-terminal domain-containing protein [Myxococcota bacterium]